MKPGALIKAALLRGSCVFLQPPSPRPHVFPQLTCVYPVSPISFWIPPLVQSAHPWRSQSNITALKEKAIIKYNVLTDLTSLTLLIPKFIRHRGEKGLKKSESVWLPSCFHRYCLLLWVLTLHKVLNMFPKVAIWEPLRRTYCFFVAFNLRLGFYRMTRTFHISLGEIKISWFNFVIYIMWCDLIWFNLRALKFSLSDWNQEKNCISTHLKIYGWRKFILR